MKNSVEARGVGESISLIELLETVISGAADKAAPLPWAGIGLTLAQIRTKLIEVQRALNAVPSEPIQPIPAAPPRRTPREIEILDEATFNSERRIIDTRGGDPRPVESRPAPARGPLGTLSGRVQVAPTVNAAAGKSRELGVKATQSTGTPGAEALSNEEAAVAD